MSAIVTGAIGRAFIDVRRSNLADARTFPGECDPGFVRCIGAWDASSLRVIGVVPSTAGRWPRRPARVADALVARRFPNDRFGAQSRPGNLRSSTAAAG